MPRRAHLAAALLLGMVAAAPAASLDPERAASQYVYRHWGLEDGLPSLSTQAIAQTPDGYLWVGTTEGLARFDGFRFELFDRSNTPEFALNEIRSLYGDSQGTLWIGFNNVGVVRYREGRFTALPAKLTVSTWCEWRPGEIILGTDTGLFRVEGDALVPLDVPPELSGRGRMFFCSAEGRALVGTGTEIWSAAPAGFERLVDPSPGFSFSAASTDGLRPIWVVSKGALYRAGPQGLSREHTPGLPEGIITILADRSGNSWVGSVLGSGSAGGLFRRRAGAEKFEQVPDFAGHSVQRLFEDRDGSLWITTWNSGLHCLSDGPFTTYTTREGLSNSYARTLYSDAAGAVWVGTADGLNRIDSTGVRRIPASSGRWIYSLGKAPDGRLAVGSRGGLEILHGERLERAALPLTAADEAVVSLLTSSGRLWVGTARTAWLWNGIAGQLLPELKDTVFSMLEDRRGHVWFGTRLGLFERRPDGAVKQVATATEPLHELIMSLHEDSRGDLWAGTLEGGVNRCRRGECKLFRKQDGLYDDTAWAILEDEFGYLWISCTRGVYRIALRDFDAYEAGAIPRLRYTLFGTEDGLASRQFEGGNSNAGIRAPDGRLWFATLAGAAVVDPKRLPPLATAPTTLLERVWLDGEPTAAASLPRLAPGVHRVEIEYTALHLRGPGKLRFRYRLQGLDPHWIEAGDRRRAEYPGVRGGRYRFEAQASLDGDTWGRPGETTLEVDLFPWQRRWVQVAAAALAALLAVLLYRLRLRQIRRRDLQTKTALEELVEFGKEVSGLLDPDEVVARLDRALVMRWGEGWRAAIARREGRVPLIFERPTGSTLTPLALDATLEDLAAWTAPRWLERSSTGGVPTLAALLGNGGALAAAPMLSGKTTFGVVAVGTIDRARPDSGRELAHLAGLAAQAAVALEGAWQAQEAIHWRHLSEARQAWGELDRLSKLVFAAVARAGLEKRLRAADLPASLVEVTGTPSGDWHGRLEQTISALVERNALRRGEDGALEIAAADWLLLPEVRRPLAEIARRTGGRVGAYLLGERIGAGGMGEVFRATNVHDESLAAVKLLYSEESADPRARKRFEREGKIVGALRHPHVVRFLERGEHEGRLYIAMELLHGQALSRLLERGPLEEDEVLRAVTQLASALDALHRQQVVHRDIKTANVMREPDGRYVLLDLGVARGPLHSTLTQRNAAIGTLPYMSPEQLRGEEADARSDLWSLGVVVCEMALGKLPWAAEGTMLMALEILRTGMVPSQTLDGLPPRVRELAAVLLVAARAERIQSAAQLLAMISPAP